MTASDTPGESVQGNTPTSTALFISAFFDELHSLGVRDVVISPGSRSTPLAMVAYAGDMNIYVDIDERGAAFFALGLVKASGRPVCAICTSGTAVANYYPAVLEAEGSRVPLILLTGDRPPQLQKLGAPQTTDQLKIFGDHVRFFQQMPLPTAQPKGIAFIRQMALTAFASAVGSQASQDDDDSIWYGCISDGGPVHLNFPFNEPLKPNLDVQGLFTVGRRACRQEESGNYSPLQLSVAYPSPESVDHIKNMVANKKTLILCGEGTCSNSVEAGLILRLANVYSIPLIADPLSNLRSYTDSHIIDNYDNIFRSTSHLSPELIIRFGRYPVSKSCYLALEDANPIQVVIDICETRDFIAATDIFLRSTPAAFVASCLNDFERSGFVASKSQQDFAREWILQNESAATRINEVSSVKSGFEGAYVYSLINCIPKGACLFSASSMSIRMIDTFYLKGNKRITVLCNRALNGIDGSLSSAIGAALNFEHTAFLTGDIAFLHDINALAMQRELLSQAKDKARANLIVVVLNNHGGGIFEMLPQRSTEPYFERLFLTPQEVDFSSVVQGFGVSYTKVNTVEEFECAYDGFLGHCGIHVIEVDLPRLGLKERYGDFLT